MLNPPNPEPTVDCLPDCEMKDQLAATLAESDRLIARANQMLAEIDARYQQMMQRVRPQPWTENGHGHYPSSAN